ncbi:MAG: phosphoenolpyruvate carboxylase, partial [Planctomycetia bacterium]
MVNDDLLRRDVRLLDGKLDSVIVELAGADASALVADIRRLARERRAGGHDAERALAARITALDVAEARLVTRALSIFFDLVNIAEDRQRARVLRERERLTSPQPLGESLAAGIAELASAGLTAAEIQQALDRLSIELVFTAHPSEAKRRSIRAKLRRMRQTLQALDRDDLLPRERAEHESHLRTELAILWETEFLKPERPTVLDEVSRGLSIMPRLWKAVPQVHESLRRGLAAAYPGHAFRVPPFLTFGSWMGGDRDGNPFVTADVTERTLLRLRSAAIDAHLARCTRLHDLLTTSLREAGAAAPLERRLESLVARWPDLGAVLAGLLPEETYRRWLRMIHFRLECSLAASL